MSGPLVSVVLPTRDRAHWVGRAIESVLAQTHRRLELIVVDDGSRDDTVQVLERYAGRIVVLNQEQAGVYAARNLALRHAKGELVAFIDSDDAWRPHRLETQLRLLGRPEVGLVFGDQVHRRPGKAPAAGDLTSFAVTPPSRGRVAEHFVWGAFVPTITVLVRRSCLDEVGGFPTSHPVSADYLTWFRIALRHELDFVPDVVADYTVHAEGISQNLGVSLQARIELFADELAHTTDPSVRRVLGRLLFVLGLNLALATVRGRAAEVASPWNTVTRCLDGPPAGDRARTTAGFVARQAGRRARRRVRSDVRRFRRPRASAAR